MFEGLKKNKKLLLMASTLVVGLGLMGLVYFVPPPFLRVKEVLVLSPLKHLSENDVIRLSGVKPGDNFLKMSLAKVRQDILRYPWIHEVRLSKQIPGRFLIWVEEQAPLAILEVGQSQGLASPPPSAKPPEPPPQSEKTKSYFMNEEGRIFKKVESAEGRSDPQDFPIITGLSTDTHIAVLQELMSLIKSFDAWTGLGEVGISEIHWRSSGAISLFTKEPALRVDLGDNSSLWEEKLKRLGKNWKMIQMSTKKTKIIDLNFEKRIVVKQQLLEKRGG